MPEGVILDQTDMEAARKTTLLLQFKIATILGELIYLTA